ncbi:hypothetical protein TeGR_g5391, partial [Tetraparma gracilis]
GGEGNTGKAADEEDPAATAGAAASAAAAGGAAKAAEGGAAPAPSPLSLPHLPVAGTSFHALFRSTRAPDELVVPLLLSLSSLLSPSPSLRVGRVTYADWEGESKSPKEVTLERAVGARSGGEVFGRKVKEEVTDCLRSIGYFLPVASALSLSATCKPSNAVLTDRRTLELLVAGELDNYAVSTEGEEAVEPKLFYREHAEIKRNYQRAKEAYTWWDEGKYGAYERGARTREEEVGLEMIEHSFMEDGGIFLMEDGEARHPDELDCCCTMAADLPCTRLHGGCWCNCYYNYHPWPKSMLGPCGADLSQREAILRAR